MTKTHELIEIPPLTSKHGVSIEVGWSRKEANDDVARVTVGGKTALISLKDLLVFAFRHGSLEQKTEAIPVTTQLMKRYKKQHRVKVSKDLKAGDEVVVNCEFLIPEVLVEASTQPPLSNDGGTTII